MLVIDTWWYILFTLILALFEYCCGYGRGWEEGYKAGLEINFEEK